MTELIIRVPGTPVAWMRAGRKLIRKKGGALVMVKGRPLEVTYTPTKMQEWEDRVANEGRKRAAESGWIQPNRDLPLCVDCDFHFYPVSGMRKGTKWKTKKPDRDNLEKAALDGLVLGCVISDDCQVVDGRPRKLVNPDWQGVVIRITLAESPEFPLGHPSRPMPTAQEALAI